MAYEEPFNRERDTHGSSSGPDENLLSRGESARYLCVSVNTIGRWATAGLLPCVLTPSGQQRFCRADLDASRLPP